eukprot:2148550-Prymnesium_polylepis.2
MVRETRFHVLRVPYLRTDSGDGVDASFRNDTRYDVVMYRTGARPCPWSLETREQSSTTYSCLALSRALWRQPLDTSGSGA